MEKYYAPSELLGLPGMPKTHAGLGKRAQAEGWPRRARKGQKGGGWEYPLVALPQETREHLMSVAAAQVSVKVNQNALAVKRTGENDHVTATAVTVAAPRSGLTTAVARDWQRAQALARKVVLDYVTSLTATLGSQEKAVTMLVAGAQNAQLPEVIADALKKANAKAGATRLGVVSNRTVKRWIADFRDAGLDGLLTKGREPSDTPAWAADLLDRLAHPQKPTLRWVIREMAKEMGALAPSAGQAQRFLARVGTVEKQRGRMLPRELKNIRPFVRRSTEEMLPLDVVTGDGHAFDAEIAHPMSGRPFRPEITTLIDIKTRRAVGFSVDLSENKHAVADAIRHAVVNHGVFAMFYVDRGRGYVNEHISDPGFGLLTRLGITLTHSLPYNSQARGVIERSHQTLWDPLAKQLPTYLHNEMDAEAKQKVYKLTRADLKLTGSSRLLMPFRAFVEACKGRIEEYNAAPHASLQGLSPNEAWGQHVANGWQAQRVAPDMIDGLFRPEKAVKVLRGEIVLFTNRYFSKALEEFHGLTVRVGYEIQDASRVWVRDMEGRHICVAEFEANKRHYFPTSVVEQARTKRADARLKRLADKAADIVAERDGSPAALTHETSGMTLPTLTNVPEIGAEIPTAQLSWSQAKQQAVLEGIAERARAERARADAAIDDRPAAFRTAHGRYTWLMERQHQRETVWTADDRAWLASYRRTPDFAEMFDYYQSSGLLDHADPGEGEREGFKGAAQG